MAGRVAPHDLEAEQALLGALLVNFKPGALDAAERIVSQDDFYKAAHHYIFVAMRTLLDKGGDVAIVTLADELRAHGEYDKAGGGAYLSQLIAGAPVVGNVEYFAKIIREYAVRRRLIDTSVEITSDAHDRSKETGQILETAEQKIFEIARSQSSAPYKEARGLVHTAIDILEKRKNDKTQFTGIPTKFERLDHMLSGLQNSEMIVIGARPSIGKTAFAISIADNVAVKQNIPVGFFTLETPAHQIMMRLLAAQSKVNATKLRNPSVLSVGEWGRLGDAAGRLYEAPIYIDDTPNIPLMALRSQARRMKAEKDIKVLFIDYLGLISVETNTNAPRWEQMSMVSRSLKALARELDIPVVVLSQVRRDAEGKEPNMADLRETGAIEQDADVVMFLHRNREDTTESEAIETRLIVAKQRNGPTGDVKLAFIPRLTRFETFDDS